MGSVWRAPFGVRIRSRRQSVCGDEQRAEVMLPTHYRYYSTGLSSKQLHHSKSCICGAQPQLGDVFFKKETLSDLKITRTEHWSRTISICGFTHICWTVV